MKTHQLVIKRIFDLLLSLILLPLLIVPIILLVFISTLDTRANGLFMHERIGQNGKSFKMFKIRSLRVEKHYLGKLHLSATTFGRWLRATKLDELPQLFNVIMGDMSFVGPRPDEPGFADKLEGDDRIILSIKPGITGPATLKYFNEDYILSLQDNPEKYNRTIIWPDKVEINKNYIRNWSFYLDLKYLFKSLIKQK